MHEASGLGCCHACECVRERGVGGDSQQGPCAVRVRTPPLRWGGPKCVLCVQKERARARAREKERERERERGGLERERERENLDSRGKPSFLRDRDGPRVFVCGKHPGDQSDGPGLLGERE